MKTRKTIWVLPPGTSVRVGLDSRDPFLGIVTAVQIREDGVRYLVAWYDGRKRREEYVMRGEIDPVCEVKPLQIGFGGGRPQSQS